MRLQEIVHVLEEGVGRKIIAPAAFVAFALFLMLFLGYKRYEGPAHEVTFQKLILAKQLAHGEGFTTTAIYPHAVANLEANGWRYEPGEAMPELYLPPLYSLYLAGGLKLLPDGFEQSLWGAPSNKLYRADVFIYVMNLILFAGVLLLAYILAIRLYPPLVAWLACTGILISGAIWQDIFVAKGTLLAAFLVLALVNVLFSLELFRNANEDKPLGWRLVLLLFAGALIGLGFLTQYAMVLILLPVLVFAVLRFGKIAGLLVAVGCVLMVVPWCMRNIDLVAHPLGLASESSHWREADSTANPADMRSHFKVSPIDFSLKKSINKGLDGVQQNFTKHLWSGGATVFAGLFIALLVFGAQKVEVKRLSLLVFGFTCVLFTVPPFFESAEYSYQPALYLSPLFIIFGVAFAHSLAESGWLDTPARLTTVWTILLGITAWPLLHMLAQPTRGVHYSVPDYIPLALHHVLQKLPETNFNQAVGLMSDIPAGASWYSGNPVWMQPTDYADLSTILLKDEIGALYLSSNRLDQPFFSKLLRRVNDEDNELTTLEHFGWGAVYYNLLQDSPPPKGFPLTLKKRMSQSSWLLLNPLVLKN